MVRLPLREELEKRGLLYQYTDEVFELYEQGNNTLYLGMDPTADSLHVGNFVGFMHALQYLLRGNHVIFIVGGATGMIGDPGGKQSERTFLDHKTLQHNVTSLTKQVDTILTRISQICDTPFSYDVRNNLDFYTDMDLIRFFREVGKYITINQMMTKETVKHRIQNPDASISYTEFSYMLMQGYDFLHLYNTDNCKLQISGSDQRGNIVTGIELIRKKQGDTAYGITTPLITDSTGKKFGKSEGNALWLDAQKTTPYTLYQYFFNQSDEDIEKLLKLFTLLSLEEIDTIMHTHNQNPQERFGQSTVARHLTQLIHGTQAANDARDTSKLLFDNDPQEILAQISTDSAHAIMSFIGGCHVQPSTSVVDTIVGCNIVDSKSKARTLIEQGGITINNNVVRDTATSISDYTSEGSYALLRKGKKSVSLISIQG